MAGPTPSLSGGSVDDFYNRVAIVRSSDNRVIDIIMSGGVVFTEVYGISVFSVNILVGEACEIYWLYDSLVLPGNPNRFYSDGGNYEASLTVPITVFPGSIAVGNNPPISTRGFNIQFPDGTTQDSAVNRTRLTTFTALQEFAAGISSGQILAVDPIDGAGLVSVKALSGGNTRIGGVRLGYAPTPTYNTFLENSSGTFTIYNGFSATGSNLLNINSTRMVVNVPVNGMTFNGNIVAPNIVYSINGCTGILGITGTINEVEVTGPCPNIVIGLPDNVTITNVLQAQGLSATTATFSNNIYAPNVVTSVNGVTGAVTNINAATVTATATNVNATRYLAFVGGTGNTGIFIDPTTTPLTYTPAGGAIGAKKVTLTTGSNVLTADSANPNLVLTDGTNISTFGLDSFAANYNGPFSIYNSAGDLEVSSTYGLTLSASDISFNNSASQAAYGKINSNLKSIFFSAIDSTATPTRQVVNSFNVDTSGHQRSYITQVGDLQGNGGSAIIFRMTDIEPILPSIDDFQLTEIYHTPDEATKYASIKMYNTRSNPIDAVVSVNSYSQVIVGDSEGWTSGYKVTVDQASGINLRGSVSFTDPTATYTYTFPQTNGSSGQALTTNGAGTLSWSTVSGGGGSATGFTYTSSTPSSPSVGDRWIDANTGKEYVYVNDGSSSQWVQPLSSNGLNGMTYDSTIKLYQFGGTGSFEKLGVGLTAPQYTLDVNGTANFRSGISAASANINGTATITGTLNGAGATFTGAVISDGGYRISSSAINAQTGTTYTLLTADNGKIITMNNGSASTVTIPSGLPIGYNTTVIQLGLGQVGFTSSGTTINSSEGKLNIANRYSAANIISYTTNTFILAGGLTA